MKRILSIILCLALAVPILESVVVELGLMDTVEFCSLDFSEKESENKESEKEEKDEKEKELFQLLEWSNSAESFSSRIRGYDNLRYESLTHDIPSPPPDHIS